MAISAACWAWKHAAYEMPGAASDDEVHGGEVVGCSGDPSAGFAGCRLGLVVWVQPCSSTRRPSG